MRKKINKLLTILFVLFVIGVFTSITVIVIIIAQGGKVTTQGIEQTGVIKINAKPSKDIKVFLDDKEAKLNDKMVENIEPGLYTLTVKKDDYTDWTKQVNIEKGIVTELYVTLFPEKLDLEQITSTNIERAFFSEDGSYVVYTITNGSSEENGIWKLKLTQNAFGLISNKPEKIVSSSSELKQILAGSYSVNIASDNDHFVLTSGDRQMLFDMNSKDNFIEMTDVSSIGFFADKIKWFKQGSSIILEKDKSIYEYNISDKTTKYIYTFNDTPVYAVNGRTLIFFAESKYYEYANDEKQILSYKGKFDLPAAETLWLSSNSEKDLYIKSGSELYYANLDEGIFKIGKYSLLNLAPHGTAAIILDGKNNIYLFRNEYLPALDEVRTETVNLNTIYSKDKIRFSWSSDSLQIILRSTEKEGTKIKLVDNYGENSYEILDTSSIIHDDYALANDSSDFVVLLNDSSKEEGESTSSNLYKIHLID